MASTIPATMKALIIKEVGPHVSWCHGGHGLSVIFQVGPNGRAVVKDHPVPEIADDEILIKAVAVALNPTDWKRKY